MNSWPGINPSNCSPECEDSNHPGAQHPVVMGEDVQVVRLAPWKVQPTVGRIVHYLPPNRSTPLAAIIVDIDDDLVNLTVFQADGTTKPAKNVMQAAQLTEYCWSWTAR